jgi:acyl-CoA reductase-like NAD-dependent aldehyde dehydrogenase
MAVADVSERRSDGALETVDLFIGGAAAPAAEERRFPSVDPTLGAPWAEVADAGAGDVDRAVRSAHDAFWSPAWRSLSAARRGRLLMRLGDAIGERAEQIAEIETRDNGKLYREMVAQLRTVPDWLYYFGGAADKLEGATIPLDRLSVLNYTLREPYGVVAVITPWNSPVFLTLMSAAPALATGNTVVVKPSEVTSASIVEVARLAVEVGFPPGALNVVTGQREAGAALVGHSLVSKIALTGGPAAGRAVAAEAARRLIPVTLELGGKSANIVFADANLDAAEAGVLAGIFAAAGQTCVAGSRALVHASIFDDFLGRLAGRAGAVEIGHPMDEQTQMGPLATDAQLAKVESFVAEARDGGAEIVAGGERARLEHLPNGYFYRPTIVARTARDSHLAREEVFGPVLAVFPFESDEEAVELANATDYGLAAGVWTRDLQRAHLVARALQSGTVWINMYRALAPQSPFGGYKSSGLGRQNGLEGLNAYLQTKSVWCELSDEVQDPFVLRT